MSQLSCVIVRSQKSYAIKHTFGLSGKVSYTATLKKTKPKKTLTCDSD